MRKPHHATAKRATENGATLADTGDSWTATKGDHTATHANAAQALDAVLFRALIAAEYPALSLVGPGENDPASQDWSIWHTGDTESPVWTSEKAPTLDDVADVANECEERELDMEEGFEEEEEKASGSIVAAGYKVAYAERGDPTHTGDWLAVLLKPRMPVTADGKVDVEELDRLFLQNGVDSATGKWGDVYHNRRPPTNGWEGRFSMSGRNILRKRVADAGKLLWNDEEHIAPEEWCAEHRTKPKAPRKSKKAKDPLDEIGLVPTETE